MASLTIKLCTQEPVPYTRFATVPFLMSLLCKQYTMASQEVKHLMRFFAKKFVNGNAIGAGGVYLSIPCGWMNVKQKSAKKCVNDKVLR